MEVDTHCTTESAMLEPTFRNNVAHLEEKVSNLFNSKGHKLMIEKKLTTAVSEILGTRELADLKVVQELKLATFLPQQ